MMPPEHKQDVEEWKFRCGIQECQKEILNTAYATEVVSEGIDSLSVEAIEKLLLTLTSYNIFLKAEKGRLAARQKYSHERLKRLIHTQTQIIASTNKWLTKEEKEANAINGNKNILNMKEENMLIEYKLDLIKDIPYAIDTKIDVIRTIYNRKIKEQKETV